MVEYKDVMASYAVAEVAHNAANAHPGGKHHAWQRMMMRNTYTVEPREPAKDGDDIEKNRLTAAAIKAAHAHARVMAEYDGTAVKAALHSVQLWGWRV